jgi:hypothetical protein
MFIKIRPLLCSLFFLLSLEVIIFFPSWVFWIMGIILVFSAWMGKTMGKRWIFSITPSFFALSCIGLFYLISSNLEEQVFVILSSSIYYLGLYGTNRLGLYEKDQTALAMLIVTLTATIFFSFASFYGIYLNFLVPTYILMLAYFLVTFLISLAYFFLIQDNKKTVLIYSLILALIMSELIWTMNFWPFGYLTTGIIALILYYILWDLIRSHFLNILSKKRVVINLFFFFLLIVSILITSKWLPII